MNISLTETCFGYGSGGKILNRVNFNQLYYFYVVSTCGSIKSAALKLNISEPAVSFQLRSLEDSIGFKLFTRSHRKLTITRSGQILKDLSEPLFNMANEIATELLLMGANHKQSFKVGVLRSVPIVHALRFSNYLWRNSLLNVSVEEHSRNGIFQGLENGSIDFALSDQNENYMGYESIHLNSLELVAFSSHLIFPATSTFPNCLDQQPYLALFNDGLLCREIEYYFSQNHINPTSFGRVSNVALIKLIVAKSPCFSIMPLCSIEDEINSSHFYRVGSLASIEFRLWGICSNTTSKTLNIKKLISAYRGDQIQNP